MTQESRPISDLILAAYLMTVKVVLSHVIKEGNRLTFFFDEGPPTTHITQLMLDFYNRQTLVDAMTFSETIRSLKAMTYQVPDARLSAQFVQVQS